MSEYYDSIAQGYNELHGAEQLRKYHIIKDQLQLKASAHVLDVGAGTGIGHSVIANVGIDPSAKLLEQHPNKKSVVGTAESIPFADKSFDAVICVTAIHHTDYKKAIKEMKRVSRGPIAITILKKAKQSDTILRYCTLHLAPTTVIEEAKDYIVIHR